MTHIVQQEISSTYVIVSFYNKNKIVRSGLSIPTVSDVMNKSIYKFDKNKKQFKKTYRQNTIHHTTNKHHLKNMISSETQATQHLPARGVSFNTISTTAYRIHSFGASTVHGEPHHLSTNGLQFHWHSYGR